MPRQMRDTLRPDLPSRTYSTKSPPFTIAVPTSLQQCVDDLNTESKVFETFCLEHERPAWSPPGGSVLARPAAAVPIQSTVVGSDKGR